MSSESKPFEKGVPIPSPWRFLRSSRRRCGAPRTARFPFVVNYLGIERYRSYHAFSRRFLRSGEEHSAQPAATLLLSVCVDGLRHDRTFSFQGHIRRKRRFNPMKKLVLLTLLAAAVTFAQPQGSVSTAKAKIFTLNPSLLG